MQGYKQRYIGIQIVKSVKTKLLVEVPILLDLWGFIWMEPFTKFQLDLIGMESRNTKGLVVGPNGEILNWKQWFFFRRDV